MDAKANSPEAVLTALARHGLLLMHDADLAPSAVSILAGEPVAGSWWSHAHANRIFDDLNRVVDDPDVVTAKLVRGKVTLCHRRLWPALVAVAVARDRWQTAGLSQPARRLLARIDAGETPEVSGPPAKELELRLLACGEQVHAPSGKHVTRFERWESWARRAAGAPSSKTKAKTKTLPAPPSLASARAALEAALAGLGGGPELLPWNTGAPRPRQSKAR
jgi:hypothetical protein